MVNETAPATVTCEYCRGKGTVSDTHLWSDGWGMVECICPLCDRTGQQPANLATAFVTEHKRAAAAERELAQLKAHVALYLATTEGALPSPPLASAPNPSPWPSTWREYLDKAAADVPRAWHAEPVYYSCIQAQKGGPPCPGCRPGV